MVNVLSNVRRTKHSLRIHIFFKRKFSFFKEQSVPSFFDVLTNNVFFV